MWETWRKRAGSAPDATDPGAGSAASSAASNAALIRAAENNTQVVRALSGGVSKLGRDAAEVRGLLEDTQKVVLSQAQAMQALGGELEQVRHAQDGINQSTDQTREAVGRARVALAGVGNEVGGIVATLRQVSDAASEITKIALQTRLVAFNASVEAKRAGEAGRGFGVVADAVKDLAAQVEASSKAIMGTVGALDTRIEAFSRELRADTAGQSARAHQSSIHQAFADVEADVDLISRSAQESQATTQQLAERSGALGLEIQQAMRNLDAAFACSDRFLRLSEQMIEQIASSGVPVDDSPYIEAVQQAAAEISALLETAVRERRIDLSALFDDQYQKIAGTDPQQYLTRFTDVADRVFPSVQEHMLSFSDKVVFCIAVDRNGYVATHNKRYCQPQRPGETAWNTANSRYRRIFNDRTGLASARNQRPFLLQTYRRDMGGGHFVLLKEASAPVTVAGKHWGGVRLAFGF
ncbi:methyl-accepting chemotaxis protein [Roseateles amylovorans]|uniref:Methyl-accepting chemotaxis protein n=1 Tax=Roseateles amylovorans TaxID=2978473 RepID=A0ABY6B3K3_9BURK|nr:methyl-accepting chemotaxis protein [Roseateles amylovorans]UXH79814.1 methyl-accepting chemotaxis protein [Roseateles amylovorans]